MRSSQGLKGRVLFSLSFVILALLPALALAGTPFLSFLYIIDALFKIMLNVSSHLRSGSLETENSSTVFASLVAYLFS